MGKPDQRQPPRTCERAVARISDERSDASVTLTSATTLYSSMRAMFLPTISHITTFQNDGLKDGPAGTRHSTLAKIYIRIISATFASFIAFESPLWSEDLDIVTVYFSSAANLPLRVPCSRLG